MTTLESSSTPLSQATGISQVLVDSDFFSPDARIPRVTAAVITCVIFITLLFFVYILLALYETTRENPKVVTESTVRVQRIAPLIHCFVMALGLAEGGLCTWILVEDHFFNEFFWNTELRSAVQLLLFDACWTFFTVAAQMVMFLHPTWSKSTIASVGSQCIWAFVTWIFWTAGAATIDNAAPTLLSGDCKLFGHCHHLRAMFALAVVLIVTWSAVLCLLAFLAWRSIRGRLSYS
ncbi:hypothetical protein SCHPADRAFT_902511 [Schizopora paradoxa]|uniref:MARVEL domain-containing protein n=1 Tax=Schizopora paradoxa TaxID=27342 RepID=A0A0H2S0D2_9AGAM|nr:hypothetical protein SCHPADRAFT_902511 [Schizopora paradoxa]